LAIFLLCFSYPLDWVLQTTRVRYLEGVEDPLVDQANILAEMVGGEMAGGSFSTERLVQYFRKIYERKVDAKIYQVHKPKVDLRVYITDTQGRIVFDSLHAELVGVDYSRWRNVQLTLAGQYGARTTLADPRDPTSSVLHVSAPIFAARRLAGVLSVAKPTTGINSFLQQVRPRILEIAGIAVFVAAILSFVTAIWLTRPIKRLIDYAEAIRLGRRAVFPALDRTEIGDLGRALNKMRIALEGKEYIEQYVQRLTHEIKSPISAIRGAAELLVEEMPTERRDRFLNNIRTEANRIQVIVDRMLELSALEAKKELTHKEQVPLDALLRTAIESKQPILSRKAVELETRIPAGVVVVGDAFLLHQAVANLLQNAIDFSPSKGKIEVEIRTEGERVLLTIKDTGPGIPEYALNKIFDKFFSLQRPEGGQKSTGLGLNLVREVAHLHRGDIHLENIAPHGVQAVLILPLLTPIT
jgi:two-component system sensor histidine kinase CreC